jgi:hypothetical protein
MSKQQIEFLAETEHTYRARFSFPASCGSFSSTTTQSIVASPSTTSLTYNTTDLTNGGIVLSGSTPTASISISFTGVYRVITSVQLNRTGGGNTDTYIWFAVDGVAVPNTTTKTHLAGSTELVMTVEVLLSLTAGQLVSIQANSDAIGNEALADVSSAPRPAIPSIITIVQRIA